MTPPVHSRLKSWQVDWVEVLLIGAAIAAGPLLTAYSYQKRLEVLRFYAQDGLKEVAPLAQALGPTRASRDVEEWAIRDFFGDRHGGFFLDVGSYHYRDESNTYFLESALGWSGIAVDAQAEFKSGYDRHRPRTRFFAYFVSDVSDSVDRLYVPAQNGLLASSDAEAARREGHDVGARMVPTITLNDLLAREKVDTLDFVSMDIELAEPKALAGFDVERYRPALVCIEAHVAVRQQILDYFTRNGYVLVGKYLRLDPKNLYFTPLFPLRSSPAMSDSSLEGRKR